MKVTKVGVFLNSGEGVRDAIHCAITPVVSDDEESFPGEHVGIKDGNRISRNYTPKVGIIDPFLVGRIYKGNEIYLFVYPGTITSLTHYWEHPAFTPTVNASLEAVKQRAVEWMHWFAAQIGLEYDEVIKACNDVSEGGLKYVFQGSNEPDACYKYREEMWQNFEIITGNRIDAEDKADSAFTCNC